MGDPGGIGPEVVVRALAAFPPENRYIPLVIGNLAVMRKAMKLTGVSFPLIPFLPHKGGRPSGPGVFFADISTSGTFRKKGPTRESGLASDYVQSPVNYLILNARGQIHEVRTIAGYSHDHVAPLLRVYFRVDQVVGIVDIELNMPSTSIKEGLDQRKRLGQLLRSPQVLRRELHVKDNTELFPAVVRLGRGAYQCGRPVDVHPRHCRQGCIIQ